MKNQVVIDFHIWVMDLRFKQEFYMIRLEELLYSLTTVIVRYHDSLAAKKLIIAKDKPEARLKSRDFALEIIKDKNNDFHLKLGEIIKNCTEGYPGRRPFLNFLLNELVLLHSFLNKKESFSEEDLVKYKDQVFRILMDFKGLLSTTKSKTFEVTQHKTEMCPGGLIALSGCINDGYTGNDLCNSGIFLKEEVLDILNISIGFSEEIVKEFANRICTEHQNALSVPELKTENQRLKQQMSEQEHVVESEDQTLKLKLAEQAGKLNDQDVLIRQQQEQIKQQAEQIKQQEEQAKQQLEQIKLQLEQIQQQEEKIKQQEELISTQRRQIGESVTKPRLVSGIGGFGLYSPSLFGLKYLTQRSTGETDTPSHEDIANFVSRE